MFSKSALAIFVLSSSLAYAQSSKPEKCFVVESIGWDGNNFKKQITTPLDLTIDAKDRTTFKCSLVSGISLDMYAGGGSTGKVPSLVVDIKVVDHKTGATSNSTAFFIKGQDDLPNNRADFIYTRSNNDTVALDCFPAL